MTDPHVQLAVFTLFFVAAAVAIAAPRRRLARGIFALVFGTLLVWFGLTGSIAWPFFGWHLYAHHGRPALTFHEVRLADATGRELRLDARAAPPTMATPLNRIGGRMVQLEPGRAEPIAAFLLDRAGEYRRRVEHDGIVRRPWWKFPPHQSGFRWTREHLAGLGPFRELRIYRIEGTFSPDGSEILSRHETLEMKFVESTERGDA